ncbi:L-iditol 2-dehydrogenase (plasmid) [Azospirillum sp. B510]|uniref:L-idonate 5-dehydrogenase n=1 Tax=Azospirillum sp. (strain B510) TaxID=137722 RepID=UPI0001C4C9AB|nr:L-idonate 5-dehydrogenase [Azospirillum sp. B510]BAI74693.1 L-iditol 2-dehydrogenase [Azospirillum sp. B510]
METRACVIHAEKDLRVEAVPLGAPGEGEVLVRVGAGGICGSDLHYYQHGGFGTVRVRQPMVLGHEVAGTIEAVGAGVTALRPGDRVALNPSSPCGHCRFCLAGEQQHCTDMWFWGSAMRFPHSQGAFRERIVIKANRCEPIGEVVSLGEAACCEPLSVALHAVRQAGSIAGKRVLVTGAGPIGALVVAAARQAGAVDVVSTDLQANALEKAAAMGATATISAADGEGLARAEFLADKGWFDVAIECTGAGPVLESILPVVRPRGTIVQVGMGGNTQLPLGTLVGKELSLRGAFRFHEEFATAARLIKERRIDVTPIITGSLPLGEAVRAFEMASDRSRHSKVQILFE